MKNYIDLLKEILATGVFKMDRTGVGCYSSFAHTLKWDLREGFPLVTTKKCHLKSVIHELLWFLKGDTNIQYLKDNGVTIWDEWALSEDKTVERTKSLDELLYEYMEKTGFTQVEAVNKLSAAAQESTNDNTRSASAFIGKDFDLLREAGIEFKHHVILTRAGEVGPMYGYQWRHGFGGVDQIKEVERLLKELPNSRRIRVTAWDPSVLPDEKLSIEENVLAHRAALASCHCDFQLVTEKIHDEIRQDMAMSLNQPLEEVPEYYLNLHFTMRSWDVFLGGPFNIASYGALLMMFARSANMIPKTLAVTGVDVHLYSNHMEQVKEQLSRDPRTLPRMVLKKPVGTSVLDYSYDDFELEGYDPHPAIKAPIAV